MSDAERVTPDESGLNGDQRRIVQQVAERGEAAFHEDVTMPAADFQVLLIDVAARQIAAEAAVSYAEHALREIAGRNRLDLTFDAAARRMKTSYNPHRFAAFAYCLRARLFDTRGCPDTRKSLLLYKKAADGRISFAIGMLESLNRMSCQAAALGDLAALERLLEMNEIGILVRRSDFAEAIPHAIRALGEGQTRDRAAHLLSQIHSRTLADAASNLKIEVAMRERRAILESQTELKSNDAWYEYAGNLYESQDASSEQLHEAIRILNVLSEANHSRAKLSLGEMYVEGSPELPKDADRGYRLISEVAAEGHSDALRLLHRLRFSRDN